MPRNALNTAPRRPKGAAVSRTRRPLPAQRQRPTRGLSPEAQKAIGILAFGIFYLAVEQLDREARKDLDKAFKQIDDLFPHGVPLPK